MGIVLALVVAVLVVAAVGYVRSHPKPADEPLETYVEEVATGAEEEIVQEAEKVEQEVVNVVKRVRKKNTTTTTPTE